MTNLKISDLNNQDLINSIVLYHNQEPLAPELEKIFDKIFVLYKKGKSVLEILRQSHFLKEFQGVHDLTPATIATIIDQKRELEYTSLDRDLLTAADEIFSTTFVIAESGISTEPRTEAAKSLRLRFEVKDILWGAVRWGALGNVYQGLCNFQAFISYESRAVIIESFFRKNNPSYYYTPNQAYWYDEEYKTISTPYMDSEELEKIAEKFYEIAIRQQFDSLGVTPVEMQGKRIVFLEHS